MANWNLDKAHSEIEFKVRHMMISTVKGLFEDFEVNLKSETEQLSESSVNVVIQVASLNTNNEQRDEHLKNADFFDVENYPQITFKSTAIIAKSEEDYILKGDLTIKEVTKPIELSVELGGLAKDPWGNTKAGYNVSGKINRGDFGLTWNAALETGGVMVSEEVKFTADLQFVKS